MSKTYLKYSNSSMEEIEKNAERMVDVASGVRPLTKSPLKDHLALASWMDKETIWRTGQDILALVEHIRSLTAELNHLKETQHENSKHS